MNLRQRRSRYLVLDVGTTTNLSRPGNRRIFKFLVDIVHIRCSGDLRSCLLIFLLRFYFKFSALFVSVFDWKIPISRNNRPVFNCIRECRLKLVQNARKCTKVRRNVAQVRLQL